MKLPIIIQVVVFIGLLFAAILCLTSHKPEAFSKLDTPDFYSQGITKLENLPSFESKEQIITLVKTLVASQSSGIKAFQAGAEATEVLGYLLVALAFLQGAGIVALLRAKGR